MTDIPAHSPGAAVPGGALGDAKLCVKCGICLPHCPTYRTTLDENESPRGRLALIDGWASGHLPASSRLVGHLDRCLLCRNCESVCPIGVPYGRLAESARSALAMAGHTPRRALGGRLARWITRHPSWVRQFARLMWSPLGLPITRVLDLLSPGLGDAALGLPPPETIEPEPDSLPADATPTRVELFTGCTGEFADLATIRSARQLLSTLGVAVSIPPRRLCCGALDRHAGRVGDADRAFEQTLGAYGTPMETPIAVIASGCGAALKQCAEMRGTADATAFARRITDIADWIDRLIEQADRPLAPLTARVALHTPCTLANGLGTHAATIRLVRRVPGIDLVVLPSRGACCGAAGSYMIEHPRTASALRTGIVDQVVTSAAELVLTSNVGCAMHLRAGLRRRGLDNVSVMHPVSLLARQVRASQQPASTN